MYSRRWRRTASSPPTQCRKISPSTETGCRSIIAIRQAGHLLVTSLREECHMLRLCDMGESREPRARRTQMSLLNVQVTDDQPVRKLVSSWLIISTDPAQRLNVACSVENTCRRTHRRQDRWNPLRSRLALLGLGKMGTAVAERITIATGSPK